MERYKTAIENAVKNSVDEVEHSFERLGYFTHLNETVAFCELLKYTTLCKESRFKYTGTNVNEGVFRVSILGKRGMTSRELCELADSRILPSLRNADIDIISITRNPCEYSREQSRYRLSIDITARLPDDGLFVSEHIVRIGTSDYFYFSDISVYDGMKMYNETTGNGACLSGSLSPQPKRVTLKAYIYPESSMITYTEFRLMKGLAYSLAIDGAEFNSMMLSAVSCDLTERGNTLTLEFTEVAY